MPSVDEIRQYIETEVRRIIIESLRQLDLYTETELQAIIYCALKGFLESGQEWSVRANFELVDVSQPGETRKSKPDLLIYGDGVLLIIAELKFWLRPDQPFFWRVKAEEEQNRVCYHLIEFPSTVAGYFIVVHDGRTPEEVQAGDMDVEGKTLTTMLISAQDVFGEDYSRWKEEWSESRDQLRFQNEEG